MSESCLRSPGGSVPSSVRSGYNVPGRVAGSSFADCCSRPAGSRRRGPPRARQTPAVGVRPRPAPSGPSPDLARGLSRGLSRGQGLARWPGTSGAGRTRRAANGGPGAAPGLERGAGGGAGAGVGAGGGRAAGAVIREESCAPREKPAGARSYGGCSGGAGPRRSGQRRRSPGEGHLAPLGVSRGPRRGVGCPRTFARSHGRRRGARQGSGAARGARAAWGDAAHLLLGADPPARPARRQVAGHRAPRLRHQPLGTAAPGGQPPHRPPRR